MFYVWSVPLRHQLTLIVYSFSLVAQVSLAVLVTIAKTCSTPYSVGVYSFGLVLALFLAGILGVFLFLIPCMAPESYHFLVVMYWSALRYLSYN